MARSSLIVSIVSLFFSLVLPSCQLNSGNTNSEYQESYEDADINSSDSYAISFRNSYDVYNYLNGKTFSGDGLNIRFYNNGHSVDVNSENIANNINIFDIGVNDNGVSYATVQISNPAGITTTFTLLAVQNQAQLIDPNDGTVYEY